MPDYKNWGTRIKSKNAAIREPAINEALLIKYGMGKDLIQYYVYLIWLVWFMNVIVNTIIFLNILIAEVNNTYQNVLSQGEETNILAMAQINFVYNKILRFLNWTKFLYRTIKCQDDPNMFDVILFTRPISNLTAADNSFSNLIINVIHDDVN